MRKKLSLRKTGACSFIYLALGALILSGCVTTGTNEAAPEKVTMIESMKVVCPDMYVRVEYAAMRRWSKAAKPVYTDVGLLIPCENAISYNQVAHTAISTEGTTR